VPGDPGDRDALLGQERRRGFFDGLFGGLHGSNSSEFAQPSSLALTVTTRRISFGRMRRRTGPS
jgi:hypothetical protein